MASSLFYILGQLIHVLFHAENDGLVDPSSVMCLTVGGLGNVCGQLELKDVV